MDVLLGGRTGVTMPCGCPHAVGALGGGRRRRMWARRSMWGGSGGGDGCALGRPPASRGTPARCGWRRGLVPRGRVTRVRAKQSCLLRVLHAALLAGLPWPSPETRTRALSGARGGMTWAQPMRTLGQRLTRRPRPASTSSITLPARSWTTKRSGLGAHHRPEGQQGGRPSTLVAGRIPQHRRNTRSRSPRCSWACGWPSPGVCTGLATACRRPGRAR